MLSSKIENSHDSCAINVKCTRRRNGHDRMDRRPLWRTIWSLTSYCGNTSLVFIPSSTVLFVLHFYYLLLTQSRLRRTWCILRGHLHILSGRAGLIVLINRPSICRLRFKLVLTCLGDQFRRMTPLTTAKENAKIVWYNLRTRTFK